MNIITNKKYYYFVTLLALLFFSLPALSACPEYDRASWGYDVDLSPHKNATVGFYTNKYSAVTDVDHIVSLKDAHDSGGCEWSAEKKRQFANDPDNQAPALPIINRTIKRDYPPAKFITRMQSGRHRFYDESRKCLYISRYLAVKEKYGLAVSQADTDFITRQNCV